MKFCFCVIMPIAIFIATLYGIKYPLKAKGTLGFNIKYFYKTEESTIFVRRTNAILLLIFNVFYSVYCLFVLLERIELNKLIIIFVFLLIVLIPALITIILYCFLFNKKGERKR